MIGKSSRSDLFVRAVALLSLWSCARPIEKPYGRALLDSAPPGRNFESFLDRAARESEIFRRRFIAGSGPALMNAAVEFQKAAIPRLAGRPGIDSFRVGARRLLDDVRGAGRLSGERAFGPFAGRWYGRWTDFEVDHHWGPVVELDPPRRVEIPEDGSPVWVRSYQYAWIGDGYGLNLVATSDPASRRDYILGYVVHVENGDLSKERARRPHVGVFTADGQLVWITAKEVFLEASCTTPSGDAAYSITGFHYDAAEGAVHIHGCFQAVYTRDPDRRPEFFSFSP